MVKRIIQLTVISPAATTTPQRSGPLQRLILLQQNAAPDSGIAEPRDCRRDPRLLTNQPDFARFRPEFMN